MRVAWPMNFAIAPTSPLFADTTPARWTDALLAETRFHLAGTMNAVEMAIRLEVSEGDIEVRLVACRSPGAAPRWSAMSTSCRPNCLAISACAARCP